MSAAAWLWLAAPGALLWSAILLLPWRPWLVREVLESDATAAADLSDVTVLIPARNERDSIDRTLVAALAQGNGIRVIVVDDQSTDGTADLARGVLGSSGDIIPGGPLPEGWSGKLWALEQGVRHVHTRWLLLLDADIELEQGIVATALARMQRDGLQALSLMAWLRMDTAWEKLLLPAFVYFFKLLYPFALANDARHPRIAAAAGGFVLLEKRALESIGGFSALRGALIDDCTLAARLKANGGRVWLGLTHAVRSHRAYDSLGTVWHMVARTAFTQLRHSWLLLAVLTVVFAAMFWLPLAALIANAGALSVSVAALALIAMAVGYVPTLAFYRLSAAWALAMPAIGTLYLAMTWSSALRHTFGRGATWKDRHYQAVRR